MTASAIAIILIFLTFLWSLIQRPRHRKLPPGPWALPVIGNLHMLGNLPHRSLRDLAKKYGPIMSMRLGTKTTIVVSSPEAAELFLKTHDTIFASRPKVQSSDYLSYGTKGMGFSEYGPYWRHIRKLCTLQFFVNQRLRLLLHCGGRGGFVVESLRKAAAEGQVVDLSEKVGELIEGITYRMVLGSKNDDTFDVKGIIEEIMLLTGAVNIGDYLPFLSPFDFQGLTKRMKRLSKRIDQLLENYRHSVWTLAELLRHPRVMKHLQQELQSVIGTDRMVEESDLPKLGYLNMVLKESFRLHPVAPLLIHMHPWRHYKNVEEFYPERFIDGNIDLRGHDFQLLPFGSGRRGCPAMQLGLTTVRLALANLVHCFNWDLPNGLKPEDVDMTETFGLSLSKTKHLLVMPIYRLY
ncbi:cytochrome P450 CYP736A12-like [Prunus yedoensis var. nudiflora]|uniref:Cytochrome P450 CYP736A12-like n=1 Tax=Prunus yedoensis var. nudiflora TaxID=2094558 RepID=A0A314YS70_PRUYE|nr:cytochrome P450 CYP736A12-like [Prunus yedoensis var. nudiflora]